jgi:guanylate kinase
MRILITLTGPTASGKTELLKELVKNQAFQKLVSVTTRPKRPGEIEGTDYYFISEDEFQKLKADNQLVQSVNFGGNNYATTKAEIDKVFGTNKVPVVIVEPSGIGQFQCLEHELDYMVYPVYISGPYEVLEMRYVKRLDGRSLTEYDNARLAEIKNEVETWPDQAHYVTHINNPSAVKEDLTWIAENLVKEVNEFINYRESTDVS